MTRSWLVRLALRLVPRSWRGAVQSDLEDEAHALGRGAVWSSWQAARLAMPLRWAVTGDAMWSDLRYAWRSLRAAPAFTATAIVTLALGIGLNVAVFSAVDRMLFRPLPYANADRLMFLRACTLQTGQCGGAFPSNIAFALEQQSSTIEDLGVVGMANPFRLSRDPDADSPLSLLEVSPGLLGTLGVALVRGRDASPDDVASRRVLAWLSHEAWTARFGADDGVLGRTLWTNTSQAEIAGVLPRGFIPPAWLQQTPKWDGLILDFDGWAAVAPTGSVAAPVVRLKPGASREAAAAEIASLVASLPAPVVRRGAPAPKPAIRVDPVRDGLLSRYRSYLWLVVAAAVAVLAIAAANLSTLLLVRGRSRAHAAAVCAAIGASRGRLARIALAESAIVCAAGALITVVVLAVAASSIRAVLPPLFARYAAGVDDLRVLGFSLLAAGASGALAGLWPAWRGSRVDVRTLLQATSRSTRIRTVGARSLLAIEAALGTALVVGGALCVRSFTGMVREDLGYVQKDLYTVALRPAGRPASDEAAIAWYDEALRAMRSMPGVSSAGGADVVVTSNAAPMRILSDAYPRQGGRYQITPAYFETLGTQPIAGRTFTESEIQAGARVAILNEAAARLIFPNDQPASLVGRVLHLPDEQPRQVIGIVPTFRSWTDTTRRPALYLPKGAEPSSFTEAVIRMAPGHALDVRTLRAALASSVGEARMDLRYVPDTLAPFLIDPRFRAVLLSVLSVTGLLLAAIGLYAVASADVAMRRYETGVRLALGASMTDIARRTIRDTCRPVLAGIACGLVFAYWSGQFVQAFLHQVDARDPWTYTLVAITLLATAVGAAWLPARRAASTDPASVLRAQ